MLITDLDKFNKRGGFPPDQPADWRTFYAPLDDLHGVLKAVLSSAQHSIDVAMYGFDDVELSLLLQQKARQQGIVVQLTLDSTQAAGRAEKELLEAWLDPNVPTPLTSVVSIGRSERGAIQHMKTVVVDGIWVINGSTNFSDGGENKQDNQLTVFYSRQEAYAATQRIAQVHLNQLQQAALKVARQGAHR